MLGLLVCDVAVAQTGASSTPATTNAPAASAPVSVPLANVTSQADTLLAQLKEIQNGLSTDSFTSLEEPLPGISNSIDLRQREDATVIGPTSSLPQLKTAYNAWKELGSTLAPAQKTLVDRLTALDNQTKQLSEWTQTWQATQAAAKSSSAPPETLEKINAVLEGLNQTAKMAQVSRTQTLSLQSRFSDQESRIRQELAALEKAQQNAVGELLNRDSVPLWEVNARERDEHARESLADQIQSLSGFIHEKVLVLIIHFAVFVLLTGMFFWLSRHGQAQLEKNTALEGLSGVFRVPVAMAALLALLASPWLYGSAPRLFLAFLMASALIPAVIVLRRLLSPSLFVILYATVFFFLTDQIRYVASSSELISRALFLAEMTLAALFLSWLIRKHSRDVALWSALWITLVYSHVALCLLLVAGLANALGYVHLSLLLGAATLSSGYLAVILYAATRILEALLLFLLQTPPIHQLGMVRNHYGLLVQNLLRFLRLAVGLFWFWKALDLFSIRSILSAKVGAVLTTRIGWDTHVIILGDILAFGLTVWASFLASRLIRFLLNEEVFPHLALPAGIPYTASTVAHYVVLMIGFFVALDFLGVQLSDFAVLAGAFGVGLGFGLQNIMNNFVSGIILLFERPIKVGDIIQVDTNAGTVESIGIRASIIRLTNGSEVIVPNGNLISNPVTNWTFSNRQRMIQAPVTVVSKTDPKEVMAILLKEASVHPLILKNPAPAAVVTAFTATVLTIELRAWTEHPSELVQIQSDLSVAINSELAKAHIVIS